MGFPLFVGLLVVAALVVGGLVAALGVVIGGVISGVFWLLTLPFRILFKLAGGLLALLFTPVFMLIAMVALVGVFIAALLPLAVLALVGWGIHRLSTRRSAASF